MKNKIAEILSISVFLLTCSFTVNANDYMSSDEVKALVAGKSAKGVHLKKDFSYDIYFSPNGEVHQIKENGDERKGQWVVNGNGKHCVEWDNTDVRKCWHVKNHRDGSYTKVKLKGDRVIPLLLWRDFKEGNTLKQ